MNDIEQKALALLNEVAKERDFPDRGTIHRDRDVFVEALCRAIEQHEAFRQEVSDALHQYIECFSPPIWHYLNKFIIPKPKPDPLVEVLAEVDTGNGWDDEEDYARQIYKALEARGLEIREKNDD